MISWRQGCAQQALLDSISKTIVTKDSVSRVQRLLWASSALMDVDMQQSQRYAFEALGLSQRLRLRDQEIYAMIYLGQIASRSGEHDRAVDYLVQALAKSEFAHQPLLSAMVYRALGNDYFYRFDYTTSAQYLHQAEKINASIQDPKLTADLWVSRALAIINKQPDSARYYLQRAAYRYNELHQSIPYTFALLNLGEIDFRQKNYEQAWMYYEQTLSLAKKNYATRPHAYALHNMGNILMEQQNYVEAERYNLEALEIARRGNYNAVIVAIYDKLYKIAKARGRITAALGYLESLDKLKGEVFSRQKTFQIEELRTRYESEKKERENEHLILQARLKENELKLNRILLFSLAIFTVIVSALAIFYYKALFENKRARVELMQLNGFIQEQKEKMAAQAQELALASREVALTNENLEELVREKTQKIMEQNDRLIQYAYHNAHRVRGPLARILGLVSLARQGILGDKDMMFVLEEIDKASHELDLVIQEINQVLQEK